MHVRLQPRHLRLPDYGLHLPVLTGPPSGSVDLRRAGKDPDEIVAAFVAKYGEQILMAPPPEGFNLAGYLVPGVAVAAAGMLIGLVLLRRARLAGQAPAASLVPAGAGPTDADREKLRRALDDVQD